MAKFLSYLQTGEELPQPPAPFFLDEESWIGTVPRTIAVAAAAVALAGQVTLSVVNQPEELPVQGAATVIEENDFILPQRPPEKSRPLAFISDEEIVLSWLVEDDQPTPRSSPQITRPLAWSEIEEASGLVNQIEEIENTPVLVRPSESSKRLLLFEEEFVPQSVAAILDDESFALPTSRPPQQQQLLLFPDDELPQSAAPSILDDENFALPISRPQQPARLLAFGDEELPRSILFDDAEFQLPPASANRSNQLAFSSAEEEISLAWLADRDNTPLLQQPNYRTIQLQLFQDDELPAIALADESFIPPPQRDTAPRALQIFEEEFVAQTTAFLLDDDAFTLPPRRRDTVVPLFDWLGQEEELRGFFFPPTLEIADLAGQRYQIIDRSAQRYGVVSAAEEQWYTVVDLAAQKFDVRSLTKNRYDVEQS